MLQHCSHFMLWFFWPRGRWGLAPQPGSNPQPLPSASEGEVLTTGPPGRPLDAGLFKCCIVSEHSLHRVGIPSSVSTLGAARGFRWLVWFAHNADRTPHGWRVYGRCFRCHRQVLSCQLLCLHPPRLRGLCFCMRSYAEAETPILWLLHVKSWLSGKDSDAGRDWGQEEKGTTEDDMAGWHHRLDAHEFEWTPRVGDGQGGLACCDSWGRKESDTTERLNWTEVRGRERFYLCSVWFYYFQSVEHECGSIICLLWEAFFLI